MTPTAIYTVSHQPSKSLMYLTLKKIKGKVVITQTNFAVGNVVSLKEVRRAIASATKQFSE